MGLGYSHHLLLHNIGQSIFAFVCIGSLLSLQERVGDVFHTPSRPEESERSRRSDQLRVAALLYVIILDDLQKMKFIIPLLTLIIGFGTGWYISGKRIQENVKSVMPEGMHETFDAVAEYLGPMSEEEVNETMDQIRGFASQVVVEMDREILWEAMISHRLKAKLEDEGKEAAIQFTNDRILLFRQQHEEGMELGDWQTLADSLYANTKSDGEPDGRGQ